jgi:hypothetical protein
MDRDRDRRPRLVRITSWVVVGAAAFLAGGAFARGDGFLGAVWVVLGLSNLVPALGLDRRSAAWKRAGQALSGVALVLVLILLVRFFGS